VTGVQTCALPISIKGGAYEVDGLSEAKGGTGYYEMPLPTG
jgi:hypothetical protein